MPLLEIQGVSKSFGGLKVLSNVDLEVHEEEIVGLIGPNGSGKTTLFNTITGTLPVDGGHIFFRGGEITGLKPYEVCRKGIGRTYQLTKPFAQMTCTENVMVGRSFGNEPSAGLKQTRREAEEILRFVGLEEKRALPAAALNLIERKRLELARALAGRPLLLLLDEIMAGLNLSELRMAVNLVRRINETGVSVIIVEHVMKAVLGLSQRVVVLDAGVKIAEGLPQDVIQNEAVIRAYFGQNVHA